VSTYFIKTWKKIKKLNHKTAILAMKNLWPFKSEGRVKLLAYIPNWEFSATYFGAGFQLVNPLQVNKCRDLIC
jgi:hypothetical protein